MTSAADWFLHEPGLGTLRFELGRMAAHARRRPLAVVLVLTAVLAVSLVAAWRAKPIYRAEAVVLMTEVRVGEGPKHQWVTREVRGQVMNVAFSQTALGKLVTRLELTRPGFGVDAAVRDLREEMDLEVVQNSVLTLMAPGDDRPESVHVIIGYRSNSEKEALMVVNALADLVANQGSTHRRETGHIGLRALDTGLDRAREPLDKLRREYLATEASRDPENAVKRERLGKTLETVQQRLRTLEQERVASESLLRADAFGLVAEFRKFDAHVPSPPMPRGKKLLLVGVLGLLFGLPLSVLLVGAFDRTVVAPEDLKRLGLVVLGHVSRPA